MPNPHSRRPPACGDRVCVRAAHRLLLPAAAGVFVAAAISAISAGEARPGAQQPAAPAGAQQTQVSVVGTPAGYVGSDTCVLCHDQEESLKGTAHAQALNPRSPQAPTDVRAATAPDRRTSTTTPRAISRSSARCKPTEVNATCLTCHNRGTHAGWEGGTHEARNLSCTTCHSVHKPVSAQKQLVKATETQVCATCHRLQVAKTERAVAHMPVREGKMSCSSCHNPHGSITNVKNLKTGSSVAELCTSCHTEMRGPVLFEHAPVRENCATCHDPHGSSNDRMLVVRMPMLCQRCHIASKHPATLYDKDQITTNKSNRMFGRSCVNCHSAVHGSNHPSGQFYMR